MKCRLLLDVVIAQGAAIFKLLSGKDKTLLIRRNSFLVLDLGFDVVNGIAGFDLKGDGLSGDCKIMLALGAGGGEISAGSTYES